MTACTEERTTVIQRMSRVLLLLLLASLEGFLSLEIQVFQVPKVHATPSSDAILPCTYSISGAEGATVGSYKWYRHLVKKELEVSNSSKDFTGRISRVNTDQFINTRSAQITIHNVIPSDSADYYCEVTFVHGGEITRHGTGTLLNVTDVLESPSPNQTLYISIPASVSGVVVVVILLVVGCYRISKQGSRQSAPRGPEVLQNVETSNYVMENEEYNIFLPVQAPQRGRGLQLSGNESVQYHTIEETSPTQNQMMSQKAGPATYQEINLYNIIP
ncbi:natural cytotoxicity triggering receptor 3-like isoform X3 [Eleutherodactylus coqui]|uniref:natural cytotoxicity triggering receptor 3-like isoform X3 n=1 Tax=Eleutherodactylus coqui TaxID=57060 RepID=UPI0034634F32